jgi:serine phosphatase RsbU (regulator of sigma subunit)
MLVTSAGQVTILERAEADLLLGIEASVHRSESVTSLDPGSTLFLYTDGLVERRGVTLDDGLAVLARALGDFAGEPLEKLCDLVINRLLPAEAEDDVALVAVRVRTPS